MSKNQRRKYHLRKRLFLNRFLDMRAFAIAIVEDTRGIPVDKDNEWKWGEIQLNLGDCQRHVAFDFDLSSKENRRNSLDKIRRIANIIEAFRAAIETEAGFIEERETQIEREAKEKLKKKQKQKPAQKPAQKPKARSAAG